MGGDVGLLPCGCTAGSTGTLVAGSPGRVERFGHRWRPTGMRGCTAFLLAALALIAPGCVATGDEPVPAAEVSDLLSPTPVASMARVDWTCESPAHGDYFMEELFADPDAALRSVATVDPQAYELESRQKDQYDYVLHGDGDLLSQRVEVRREGEEWGVLAVTSCIGFGAASTE